MTLHRFIPRRLSLILHTDTRRRLASGAIWGGLTTAGSRGAAVLASFFLARILGKEGFGEYGMINSTAAMIGSLAGMGIGLTVTKHVAEFRNIDPDKVGRILALSSMVTMISAMLYGGFFVLLAPLLSEKTLAAPHLAPMLQISAITVALGVVNGVQTSSLAGVEAFRVSSMISLTTSLIQTALVLIGAWQLQLKGAVVGMAAGMIITVLVTRIVVSQQWTKHKFHLHWREAFQEWRVLVHFSLPTFLTLAMIGPGYWISNALLANEPNGYSELGVFNAATQWQGAIAFLPGLIGTAMVPVMSQKIGSGDTAGSLKIMWKMMGMIACIVIPVALIVSIASPWIMAGYGSGFQSDYPVIVILCGVAVLSAVMFPTSQYVISAGLMWPAFCINAAAILVMIAASWGLVRFGVEGLSFARLASTVFHSLLFLIYVGHQHRMSLTRSCND